MTNLPDGVTEDDLPGNWPEDIEAEAEFELLYEFICERLDSLDIDEGLMELLTDKMDNMSNQELQWISDLDEPKMLDWIRDFL